MRKILFFHAPWCHPCRFYEKQFIIPLEKEKEFRERIQRIDAQQYPMVAEKYMIDRLPTVLLLDGEKICRRYTGGMDLVWITEWLKENESNEEMMRPE